MTNDKTLDSDDRWSKTFDASDWALRQKDENKVDTQKIEREKEEAQRERERKEREREKRSSTNADR
jgi:hypothetical protein